jgi:8-oxo-dGTP diphosphatase
MFVRFSAVSQVGCGSMTVAVVAAIIRKNGRILITQRPDNVHLARLWEFPGGKVESGETFERALQREILEELGVHIRVDTELCTIDYDYPAKSVRLHFYNCTIVDGDVQPLGVADLRWVAPQHLGEFEFPPADLELIAKLRNT